ncbi:MAG: sigma-54 dependent transcriptional regulator [Desulfatitalea sp.]
MDKAAIVIIEAHDRIYQRFGGSLSQCGHKVRRLLPEQELAAEFSGQPFDLIIAGDPLPRWSGLELMAYLKKHSIGAPVVMIAEKGTVHSAVEAIRLGVVEYLLVSDDDDLLHKSIEKISRTKGKNADKAVMRPARPGIVTQAPNMRQLLEMAQRIAPSSATVLIQGESGTGKELLARFIHSHSGRAQQPFVAMNCAALPDNLAESELFGYERGAFTGAVQRKTGKFELAQNGTLLLDEISELPLALQAKLLRVLQEKEVDRIGGQSPVPVDVRVIATTNRDLTAMVNAGQFRKDLYYRLRIIPLTIPPLRDRPQDIALLIDHFVRKFNPPGDPSLPHFDAAALERITTWAWPGNVRELENTVERAMLIRNGPLMGPELLLLDAETTGGPSPSAARLVGMTVKELEERLIDQTLHHVHQNRTHAAEMLGISIRTLRNKLREYRQNEEDPPAAAQGR